MLCAECEKVGLYGRTSHVVCAVSVNTTHETIVRTCTDRLFSGLSVSTHGNSRSVPNLE